jgi:3-oxoacyl-[acyl-carrier-protein] synthase II
VNAHGTGTPLNDVAETKAYESAFCRRSRPIPVSSTKSYIGHCLGAAGALEAAITIAAIRAGALFPTLRLSDPIDSPSVEWLTELRCEPLPLAMSVSAGFGGSNAALIFSGAANPGRSRLSAGSCKGQNIVGIGSVTPYGPIAGPIPARPIQPAAGAYRVEPFRPTDVVPGLKTRRLDRLSVWALVAASLAIKDARLDLSNLDRSRIAVVFGTGLGCIELTEAFFQSADKYGWSGTDAAVFPETLGNSPASHVARVLDLRGPNLTVSSKGRSGECALEQAASLLRHGQADMAVVLAGDTLTRTVSEWFEVAGAQFVPSEGVTAIVLTTEPTAHSYGPLHTSPTERPDPVARGLVDSGALLQLVLELP